MTTPAPIVLNDRYTLDRAPLGRGGMGEVWGGHDTVLDRRVAVKLIRLTDVPDDLAELEKRFLREARVMARLGHPGAPAIHDAGVGEGASQTRRMFIVMEYVDGIRLDDVIAETETLPLGWVAAVGAQVAAVLAAAHGKGVLHRDLKPSNLILCPDGAVRSSTSGWRSCTTRSHQADRSGAIIGPPVHAAGAGPSGRRGRSDLYALGCVLYEMIGRRRSSGTPSTPSDSRSTRQSRSGSSARRSGDLTDLVAELLIRTRQATRDAAAMP